MIDIKKIITNCNQLKLEKNNIKKELVEMLDKYCKSYSVEFESLFTSFLTVCSSLCSQSYIQITKEFTQPFSLYSIIALQPSQHSSLPLIRDSLRTALNQFNECSNSNSQIEIELIRNLSRSISQEDHLINELSKHKCLIQFRNDLLPFNMKLSEFVFSRSIESKLYDGLNKLGHNSLIIEKPRLAILIEESSSNKLVNLLNDEKMNSSQNENLIYETLITCSKSTRLNLTQLVPFENKINLVHVFFVIITMHRINNNESYQFNKESFAKLSSVIDTYNRICEVNELNDQFISKIYGKSISQFIRLIGVLHVIENSLDILNNVPLENLSQIKLTTLYNQLTQLKLNRTIQLAHVNKSIQINNYYLLNKLCLSGYDFEDTEVYSELNIEKTLLKSSSSQSQINQTVTPSLSPPLLPLSQPQELVKNLTNSMINLTPKLSKIANNQQLDTHHTTHVNEKDNKLDLTRNSSTFQSQINETVQISPLSTPLPPLSLPQGLIKNRTNTINLIEKTLTKPFKLTDKRSKSTQKSNILSNIITTNKLTKKSLTCLDPIKYNSSDKNQ